MSDPMHGKVSFFRLLLMGILCVPASLAQAQDHGAAQGANGSKGRLQSQRLSTASHGIWAPTAAPSLSGSPVEYLILTNDAMAAEFQRLADWKTRKGVPTVVRTLDDVVSTAVHGVDLPETIRNYIRSAYQLWGVRFVLLGGDTVVIPARYASMEFLGLHDPISDLYYSCLDGTWNADGDAAFGEAYNSPLDPGDDADLLSEVFLGRAPVQTAAEAAVFVDKTLAHESPPVTDHLGRILVLAEVLFPANYQDNGFPPSGDGAIYGEEIEALVPAWMQSERRYEASSYWPGSNPLTLPSAIQEMDKGYGTVVHIGHGYRYTLSMGTASMDVGDAASLSNGARAGLFYMLNCTATAFDFESMAEALLLNPQGGATIVVGAAREAFPAAARDYQVSFFEQLYQAQERRVGVAMTRSRELFVDGAFLSTVDRWTQFVYTLLGDPETSIWTRLQSNLQLLGLPASLPVGGSQVTWEVRDDAGAVSQALVAGWKEGDVYVYGRTDVNGMVQFDIEPASTGTLSLTVTAADHLPVHVDVPIAAADIALVIADSGMQDDGGTAGFGNLDGRADAGETVRLHLPLRNEGSSTASAISGVLSTSDPLATVLQANGSWSDLGSQVQQDVATVFEVALSADLVDGNVVAFELALQHAGGNEIRHLELLVHAARLHWVGLRLDDSRAGNGDDIQDASEEVDLFYTLRNLGSGSADAVQLSLESADAGLQILQAATLPASLAPGAIVELPAVALSEIDVVSPRSVDLRLQHRQQAAGIVRTLEMRLPGTPTDLASQGSDAANAVHLQWTPPLSNDLFGYRVERALQESGPWQGVHQDVLRHATFRDDGLVGSTRYWYRVQALDVALQGGAWSVPLAVSTNPPQLSGWPLPAGDFTASSPAVGDLQNDGVLEVVAAANNLMAWDAQGVEVKDADNNAFTWGVFAGNGEIFTSIALADLDPIPGKEIVAATWDAQERFVTVVNKFGAPLPGWPQPLVASSNLGAQVAPVVVNLDEQGAPEIILVARDGRIYAWHADGSEVVDGDADAQTTGVFFNTQNAFLRCAPGIADLDPSRAGLEMAIGTSFDGKLYVFDAQGTALPGWPRTVGGDAVAFGTTFASGITIGDLDGDSMLEMVFLESSHKLHAMHLDGTELPGFPVAGIKGFGLSLVPSPALADLAGDSQLEIVVCSSDGKVHLIDAHGVSLPGSPFLSGAESESSPLVGNLDDDLEMEVLLGNEAGILQAWNLDGSPVDGFPIVYGSEIRATPTLADVNGDGNTDLVVQTWNGSVHVLDLGVPWVESLYPWPTYRGNAHRTGEYAFEVPTAVAVSDVQATYVERTGVQFSWRAVLEDRGSQLLWRLHREGPFASDPLANAYFPHYTGTSIGEISGSGRLAFVDADIERGSWYAYSLELQETRRSGDTETSLVAVVSLRAGIPPAALRLLANVPNPFNPGTQIEYEVPEMRGAATPSVRLHIFDVQGRLVRSLVEEPMSAGFHVALWNGRDDAGVAVATGVYIARLQVAGQSVRHKMTLMR